MQEITDELIFMQSLLEGDAGMHTPFEIASDQDAEWAARRICHMEAERDRVIQIAKACIETYQAQIDKVTAACSRDTDYLRGLLEQYFDTVPHQKAKTQETYRLATCRLKRKRQEPKYDFDQNALLSWAAATNSTYVRTKMEPAWSAIKEACIVEGDALVHRETGEVVPGVKVVPRPPVFSIDPV